MRKFLLVLLLFISSGRAFANFDYNNNCIQAYKALISLKLPAARLLIDREKVIHPKNGVTILLDNYYDYFKILTTENKAEFDRLKGRRSNRLDALNDEDESSPYYNFARAEINLQWALLHSRFGEYTTAGFCINKAYRQLQSNQEKFPGFLPDDIPLGVVNIMLDVLPDGPLKSVLAFFGIKGSTSIGIHMLQNLVVKLPQSGYAMYQPELVFYLTYLQSDVLDDSNAYGKMLQYTAQIDSSSLLRIYIEAHTALRTGHSTEAVQYLHHRPDGPQYQPYPYLDYMEGIARLNIGNADAGDYLNKFLRAGKSSNYIKDSYLRLGWQALLQGDVKRYQAFARLVKTNGYTYIDRDKQSLTEVNEGIPDIELLQARLYYDGGLYDKALAILKHKAANVSSIHDKTEYYYRSGRAFEALNNDKEALINYQQAINTGRSTNYYFATAAAQRMGSIYEQHKDIQHALASYNTAVALKTTAINSSYQQKARLGLKRLK
jgi:tetratricopeptide (TPR) repeat protein